MDDQNLQPQQPPVNSPAPVPPPSVTGQRTLQPSTEFLKQLKTEPLESNFKPAPTAPPNTVPVPLKPEDSLPPGIHPLPPQAQATTPNLLPTSKKDEEYHPENKKVYERASSLQIYAIVILILNVLGLILSFHLLSTYSAINHSSVSIFASSAQDIRYLTAALPTIAAIIFLISKNLALVKALLIVILINYAVSIMSLLGAVFSVGSNLEFSAEWLVAAVIPIIFLIWTWSVYSEVSLLN